MEQKRVVLLAHDIASGQGLEALDTELRARGWATTLRLARGKDFPDSVEDVYDGILDSLATDVLILGMSSKEHTAREELKLGFAAAMMGIPIFFYCDLANTWARPFFAKLIRDNSKRTHFFVLHKESAEKLLEMYPDVIAHVTGKPGWEQYGAPTTTRDKAREMMGVLEDQKVILCPGVKDIARNMILFGGVIEAAASLRPSPTVVLSVHGGDPAGRDAYLCLREWSDIRVVVPEIPECRASIILPGADLVVQSMSTIGEEAGFQRIPTINYISHPAWVCHYRESGLCWWPPIDQGLEDVVWGSTGALAEKISVYLNEDSIPRDRMREKQRELLTPREPGTAARLMADAVESAVM